MNLDYRPRFNETLAEDPITGDTWTIHHSDELRIGSLQFVAVSFAEEGDAAWGIDAHRSYWNSEDILDVLFSTPQRFTTPAR